MCIRHLALQIQHMMPQYKDFIFPPLVLQCLTLCSRQSGIPVIYWCVNGLRKVSPTLIGRYLELPLRIISISSVFFFFNFCKVLKGRVRDRNASHKNAERKGFAKDPPCGPYGE